MTSINLLPWREHRRDVLKKHFYYLLIGAFCFGIISVGFIYFLVSHKITSQTEINRILNTEVSELVRVGKLIDEIQKEQKLLEKKIQVIHSLQSDRSLIVRFFEELAKAVPDGLYLTKLIRKEKHAWVEGVTESNSLISEFMRKIEASAWVAHVVLIEIKSDSKQEKAEYYVFKLQMELIESLKGESQ